MRLIFSLLLLAVCFDVPARAQSATEPTLRDGGALIAEYFREETAAIADRTFSDIDSLADWEERKPRYRQQLLEMLGLDPMPEETPLEPVVTGTVQEAGVIVEKLHFQSMPGLYVTANLYRPVEQTGPLPAILYVCGHANVKRNGESLGNKTAYQHHGGWFARNGYVCLTIDTVQLGEIEGIHHGTYREDMWWWNNRGYSSAGVEAYNCVRALDYLQTRDEVDAERIGVTGRSGGGVYSWWIAAIDERIKVAVPVAGITSLKNHVVDGCVEGHCDCMYMVNTYRWDFPMVAALVAPRPLLITNSDKDRIFPLDGVVDVYTKTREIYRLYDATDRLGLQISEGPHKDTQELRVAAFRWMNRFLKDEDELIEMAAEPLFERHELRVFEELPQDERVSTIQESFVPKAEAGDWQLQSPEHVQKLRETLREKTFGGWPQSEQALNVSVAATSPRDPAAKLLAFSSQTPYRLHAYVFGARGSSAGNSPATLQVTVLDEQGWQRWAPVLASYFPEQIDAAAAEETALKSFQQMWDRQPRAFLVPRGVGPTAWSDDERTRTHIRRRFMLLGQTQAGMRVYDIKRGIEALRGAEEVSATSLTVQAAGDAAVWAAYASLFVDPVAQLELSELPESNRDAPDLLNVSRFVELADVVKLARQRSCK